MIGEQTTAPANNHNLATNQYKFNANQDSSLRARNTIHERHYKLTTKVNIQIAKHDELRKQIQKIPTINKSKKIQFKNKSKNKERKPPIHSKYYNSVSNQIQIQYKLSKNSTETMQIHDRRLKFPKWNQTRFENSL